MTTLLIGVCDFLGQYMYDLMSWSNDTLSWSKFDDQHPLKSLGLFKLQNGDIAQCCDSGYEGRVRIYNKSRIMCDTPCHAGIMRINGDLVYSYEGSGFLYMKNI